jgi:aminopeptidase N
LARNVAIGWACYVGSPECLEATNNRLKEVISTGQVLEADLRYAVLCNGLRQADESDYLAIWIIMTSNTQQADRNMMIDALGCSQNPDLLRTFLESTILVVDVNYSVAERIRILNSVVQGGIVGVRAVLRFLDLNLMQTITR